MGKFVYFLFFLVAIESIFVNKALAREASLQDYWGGKAEWKFRNSLLIKDAAKWQEGADRFINLYGYQSGTQIFVKDGVWYMVAREYDWENKTLPKCLENSGGQASYGTTLRKSLDAGKTWSWPVTIVPKAVPNTAWECGGTDGSLFFDRDKSQWIYLFQCFASDGHWNGCLATRNGPDPFGEFEIRPIPVIKGGDLWKRICDSDSDICSREAGGIGKVFDEGTFDIYDKIDSYYYISFHGFDGNQGFRGVARTKDFLNYEVGNDSILSKRDSVGWRETWQGEDKGFGLAKAWKENGKYYLITESMDINLLCTKNQNWDFGIVRSDDLWLKNIEQLPEGNPVFYSSKRENAKKETPACDLQYASIFQDDKTGKYYLHISRDPDWPEMGGYTGIYIYELETKNNLLDNGNFDRCDFTGWNRMQPAGSVTNYLVMRRPEEAFDGRCFLSTNCGGDCKPGQSIYYDVKINPGEYSNLRFGAAINSIGAGQVLMKLWQMDMDGKILEGSEASVITSNEYKQFGQEAKLNPVANKLRLEFYLEKPMQYSIDEAFVEPVLVPEPTTTKSQIRFSADLNQDDLVNLGDFMYWKRQYMLSLLTLDEFLKWRTGYDGM